MSRRALLIPVFAGLMGWGGACFSAPEPWSDGRLPVTNGIALWLDVSRQNAARGTYQLAPLRSWSDSPDYLFDGSGHRRHLHQALLTARPRFRQEFNGAMLSFDGTNDFLAGSWTEAPSTPMTNATFFLVVAPKRVGGFSGPLSLHAPGRNDYTSGLNVDFGSAEAAHLASVNVEGAGFSGERNLLGDTSGAGLATPDRVLGRWHLLTIVVGGGAGGVKLFLDGQPQRDRDRGPDAPLSLQEMTLGARHYSNSPDRPFVQNFFAGDFAEVLVFDRVLPDAERETATAYLSEKYGALLRGLEGVTVREGAVPLVPAAHPPPVQVHFPGFTVQPLPVALGNINNLRCRPDGKLLAVGYDGRIWLLSDADGDGLEDTVEAFWDRQSLRSPIGAALTPPGYSRGDGVFVAAKDKVALIVDTDGDGRADREITVATWTERSEQQGVDALGVAVAADGSVYFSLGAASFTDGYLVDRVTGESRYPTFRERGTIQRVSPDFSRREAVCTGIRFAVGMAFNGNGDLFVTEQEGATWLPNGNPFDELLHIQPGRHYGFPPRHPRLLPNVIDEPSVFDYSPQHQSTCGLWFNRPWHGVAPNGDPVAGPVFGPAAWADDALVCGYSRGKIWRTTLVKTPAGYVGKTHLLATLQALTVDATVSARGDLIVATHSGQPDWGSGPNGKGQLWRIRYADPSLPQPVAAWNASPTELQIGFDRPLELSAARDLAKRARIESGKYVAAADRLETIRPGYQVVYDQLSAPRHVHEILGIRLSPDQRTLSLLTRPRYAAVNYAVTLPSFDPRGGTPESPAETDLQCDLSGVEARWTSSDGVVAWEGTLPHADLAVARALTQGSAEQLLAFERLENPGLLTLRGQLDLRDMLQPAVQPGASLDYARPAETVGVRIEASAPFTLSVGDGPIESSRSGDGPSMASVEFPAAGRAWHPFEIRMATGAARVPTLQMTWSTSEDSRPRPFPVRRFLLPFAMPAEADAPSNAPGVRVIEEISGGDWLRGRRLFFGDRLACGKCHTARGEGGHAGPDLSNLVHRDYASVRKDIEFPNAAINPDHLASVLELAGGDAVSAIVQREEQGTLTIVDGSGRPRALARSAVTSIRPSSLSLMPEGLWAGMSSEDQRDLMTFLLRPALEPVAVPDAQGFQAPPMRRRSEIAGLIRQEDPAAQAPELRAPLRLVLCASPKDRGHGAPGFHDYPQWRERWSMLLGLDRGTGVEVAEQWPAPEQWQRADLVVFYHDNPGWSAEKGADLDAFLARGGGLVFIHWSLNAYRDVDALKVRLGRAWGPGARFRYGFEDLAVAPHAISAGFPPALRFTDEAYWNLPAAEGDATVIASSVEEGQSHPQVWVREQGKGRVFVCIPGHFTWTFDDPLYRVLLLRGMAWAAHQPLDRFDELVTLGARMTD